MGAVPICTTSRKREKIASEKKRIVFNGKIAQYEHGPIKITKLVNRHSFKVYDQALLRIH